MSDATSSEVPLSPDAQEAKELMHQQLMRKMANKMMAEAIEEERQRRIKSEQEEEEDAVRRKAVDQLVVVQEDLVRCLNLMRVRKETGGGGRCVGAELLCVRHCCSGFVLNVCVWLFKILDGPRSMLGVLHSYSRTLCEFHQWV